MRVGLSEVNITPAPGLPRAGMPDPQSGQGTDWPLMGRVFVFDDGARRAAVVTLDLLFLQAVTVAELRAALLPGTGLAAENVLIACSHTHWGPHTAALMDEDADFAYLDFVRARLVEAAAQAVRSLQPARLKAARIQAGGWAFNRRPIFRTSLGDQVGTQGPQWVEDFVRMEGPEDPELGLLLVEDLSGKPLGGLVNFSCHPTCGPDDPLYSSDYPGPLTAALAERLGGVYGFLQGCAGNIWAGNMTGERIPQYQETGTVYTRRMGESLAERAIEALQHARKIELDSVSTATAVLRIAQRRPTRTQVQMAKWFLEKRPAGADLQAHMLSIYGHPYTFYRELSRLQEPGIQSGFAWQEEWFARGLLGKWEQQRRSGWREPTEEVEVQAIALGDAVIVAYPAEYFVEYGLQTKARSPFPDTFVSELSNGYHGYIPTREAFAHGGYETRLGDASWMAEETGDLLCEAGHALVCRLWQELKS
jgi:neutral ceramidase